MVADLMKLSEMLADIGNRESRRSAPALLRAFIE